MPERRPRTESAFVQTFRNLTGLPSYHYDGVFGRIVHEQLASMRSAIVALELPAALRPVLEWAATCWPTPLVALERGPRSALGMVVPFVPGDSIFEAFRLASQAGIEIALIDVDVWVPKEQRPKGTLAVGPEFAARPGQGFFAAIDALNTREEPLVSDLAREAAMAATLSALMAQHESVLWVGGFAHWSRIVERLRSDDFSAPEAEPGPRRRFAPARLGSSALVRLTGVYPASVAAFARAPGQFEPFDAMRTLLHQAAASAPDCRGTPPEPAATIDLARTALYARNLAATARISEQPQLAELVLAASATVGPRYAARLFALATAEHAPTPEAVLDALTFDIDPRTRRSDRLEAGFCFRGKRLSAEPWFPVPWPILDLPDVAQLMRDAHDAEYERLPGARPGETLHWHAYPPDQEAYERFVRYALRRASQLDLANGSSAPFVSGLEGGLDVRATIRFSHEDQIYVRQHQPTSYNIRNGVIDWTSRTEDSDILRGGGPHAGWNDPDSRAIGSVSREVRYETIGREGPAEVTRRWREWSFVTLDCPTWEGRAASGTLWDLVIKPLVDLKTVRDDVYDWLELVFSFCEGKPFVYYSRYSPSARIVELARSHKVQFRWCPLSQLSPALRERHASWRQLWLADSQWRGLRARLATGVRNRHDPQGVPARVGHLKSSGIRANHSGSSRNVFGRGSSHRVLSD